MRPTLTVWPDGLWLAADELGSMIAKGTWWRAPDLAGTVAATIVSASPSSRASRR